MKIGLISDSHGATENVERVAEIFRVKNVEFVIHTGDVTRPRHLQPLLASGWEIHLALGNMDTRAADFQYITETSNLTVHGAAGHLKVRNSSFGITHGHQDSFLRQLRREKVDYLIHGHTHERRDEQIKASRVINPGAAKPPRESAAILNFQSGQLEFIDL